MKNGLILMTALPPTVGHKFLIEFAREFMYSKFPKENVTIHVLVNSRDFEPLNDVYRADSLNRDICDPYGDVVIYSCKRNDVPQTEKDHPDFWNFWKNLITKYTRIDDFHYVFASEMYGIKLAQIFDAEFIPCDINREIFPISATKVRKNTILNFDKILPSLQEYLKTTVTFFGPESVGKTTASKMVYFSPTSCFRIPEYARGYLETVGPELTEEKMINIIHGQNSLQINANLIENYPFILRDTDLLSTYGYYKLWQRKMPEYLPDLVKKSMANLYILMNDEIPFTPDILRYGGNTRESNNYFWKYILKQFDANFYEVKSVSILSQREEIEEVMEKEFYKKADMRHFQRER